MNYLFLLLITISILTIIILNRKIICLLNKLSEYESLINEQGEKNHEYKNQLLVLKGYLDDKKKLEEYLNTLIDDHRTGDNYEIRQLSKIKQPGIKQLLYCKIQKIKKSNITFCPYISDSIENDFNNYSIFMIKDITKILGVLLDNSIFFLSNSLIFKSNSFFISSFFRKIDFAVTILLFVSSNILDKFISFAFLFFLELAIIYLLVIVEILN